MSRDKQIEEMASIINLPCSGHCEECPSLDCGCLEKLRAVSLYNAGYRKASDVAEEIFAAIEEMVITEKSNDGCALYLDKVELAELKKKYTEVAERREGVENSPVDCSTPNVTDSKGERNEQIY